MAASLAKISEDHYSGMVKPRDSGETPRWRRTLCPQNSWVRPTSFHHIQLSFLVACFSHLLIAKQRTCRTARSMVVPGGPSVMHLFVHSSWSGSRSGKLSIYTIGWDGKGAVAAEQISALERFRAHIDQQSLLKGRLNAG